MASSTSKNPKGSVIGAASSSGSNKISIKEELDTASGATSVQIPLIRNKDNAKTLPTYTSALQRSADDYLAAEDLDNIQLELETLLSSVAMRCNILRLEYDSLDKDERRSEKKAKHALGANEKPPSPAAIATASTSSAGGATTSSGKRKREEYGSVRKPKNSPASSMKHTKHIKSSPVAMHADDNTKMSLPKNDTPNKFWLSVEPYCMPLTNEDMRLLDDLLDQYSGPLVPPIPELGPHYSSVWAAEDLKEIQQSSNPNANSNRLKPQNSAPAAMLKKADSIIGECVTGQLTQRLVSALLEEQLVQNPAELAATAESSNSSSENTHSSAQLNFRSLSLLRNGIDIEKRVKKELIDLGILELSDFPGNDGDEIFDEIKRLISELSSIAEHNSNAFKRLHEAAVEEIKRLEIKHKLDSVDQEILEAYKRTMQNKAKRKPLDPEEQQEIFRLTAEQKALSDQLEKSRANCYFYE